MALQKRQKENERIFAEATFRIAVFEKNPLTLTRIVNYLKNIKSLSGKPKFHSVEGVKTVREAVILASEQNSKNPIHCMVVKFEHPTIDEMEVVENLSPCVKFPVVAICDPGSMGILKPDLEKAEKLGLYCAIEWDSFSGDIEVSQVKTLISKDGCFSPVRWTHERVDQSLKERLLRILFRQLAAKNEYDVVFGDLDGSTKAIRKIKTMEEEKEQMEHTHKKKTAAKRKKIKNVAKTGAKGGKKIFGAVSASAAHKVKLRLKMLKLSAWHKKFGRKDMQAIGGRRKFGITKSLQRKLRRKSTTAKQIISDREPIEAPRDVLQEQFLRIEVPKSKYSFGDSCMHEAIEYMETQNYRMAVDIFTKALVSDPSHFHCRFYRAITYATVGRYRWARTDFIMCKKKEPDNLYLLYNLALASLNCHMHKRATRILKTACEIIDNMKTSKIKSLNPEVRDNIWRLRGLVNRRRGAYNEARVDYVYLHKVNEHVDQGNYDEDFEEYKHRMLQSLQAHDSFKSNLSGVQSALLEHGPARSDDEINVISNWLHQYRFFDSLDEYMQRNFCKCVSYEVYESGNLIYKHGQRSNGLYVIFSGSVTVKAPVSGNTEQVINHLFQGDMFGELEMIDKRKREHSVYCREPAEILQINSVDFDKLGLGGVFYNTIDFKRKVIEDSGIFQGTDPPPGFIAEAARASTFKIYNRDETIIKQGRRTNSIYFVIRGICRVLQKGDKIEEYDYQKRKLIQECAHLEQNYMFHHELLAKPATVTSKLGPVHVKSDDTATAKNDNIDMERHNTLASKYLLRKDLFSPTDTEVTIVNKNKEKAKVTGIVNTLKNAERNRRIKGSSSIWGGLASLGQKKKENEDKNPICEITKLLPPSYFGHSCLLESHEVERASIVTETRVAVLRMMVPNLDFSFFNHFSREKLKARMPIKLLPYKGLLVRHKFEKGWDHLRKDMMLEVPKSRWPLRNAIVRVETGGKYQIVDKPKPHGTI